MESSVIAHCDFDSGVEREHAYYLEYERQMGRIEAWKHHLVYPLAVNGKTVCDIEPDFTVWYPNGQVKVMEIKGGQIFKTPVWSVKRKLFMALFPHIEYITIDKFKRRKPGRKKQWKSWDKNKRRKFPVIQYD